MIYAGIVNEKLTGSEIEVKQIKDEIKRNVDDMNMSDVVFLRRILVALEEYGKEKYKKN